MVIKFYICYTICNIIQIVCYRNVSLNSLNFFPNNGMLYNNPQYNLTCPVSVDSTTKTIQKSNLNKYKLLDKIEGTEDLKKLPEELLPELCNEIRLYLGEVISKVGGHFSGSLGVTELTVALHYVFDSPFDKIVWDIGHQAYVHKILTGRKDKLHTIKRKGHSSTSISSLQGLLEGFLLLRNNDPENQLNSVRPNYISVIGDGGMTGGMAYESLNYAINIKSPVIVIYNDNDQVSLPTGMKSIVGVKPIVPFFMQNSSNKPVRPVVDSINELFTNLNQSSEEGIQYNNGLNIIGPIDGHNLNDLLYLFKLIKFSNTVPDRTIKIMDKEIHGPLMIHIKTIKGYCCPEALGQLDKMHAIKPNTNLTIVNPTTSPFSNNLNRSYSLQLDNIAVQNQELTDTPTTILVDKEAIRNKLGYNKFDEGTFSNVFSNTLIMMGIMDEKVAGITAAMPGGTGIGEFGDCFPNRTFDVGICEQHAVTFSAGLALSGVKPYVAIYSTFLQRALDQVIHDVAIQNIPIRLIVDRAGYVGEDGLSHHGPYDLNFLRPLKNFVISSPSNQVELVLSLLSSLNTDTPYVVRYPKSKVIDKNLLNQFYSEDLYDYVKFYKFSDEKFGSNFEFDTELNYVKKYKSKVVRRGRDVVIYTLGPILYSVVEAVDKIGGNFSPTIVDARFLNPFDIETFSELAKDHKYVITAEDSVNGGLGLTIIEHLQKNNQLHNFKVKCINYPYEYVHHATIQEQKQIANIDAKGIQRQIEEFLKSD
uniref:1-deoxy-D-xylulose-5-phosphate synthase n=1 Tax=Theileria parva TaxID=5875 RepID=Q4N8F5_THEPA|eukprot:XP_766036.1 1-deoxy-D-xylulose 5-phosphate synthase [Theileria parva strain Muguga]